jgi:5-methyltetrahydrofolate--homocysteine methyltransferase
MAETVSLLKKRAPSCKTMVGGAVLNAEYAERIGADFYAKDAMEAVRLAESMTK